MRGGGGLGSATIDVSEIISPLTNFLLSNGVTRGIITLLKSNVVINTFDLHVLSKKPAHEGQKSSSPHTISLSRCLFITLHNTFSLYLKNVKQLKWNFDKMSICDSEKIHIRYLFIFLKSNQNIKITKQSLCVCFEWLTFNTEIYLLELSNYFSCIYKLT